MKVAVWHNLPSGGGKLALHDHVRGLVMRGHRVESWCPPTADQTYLPLDDHVMERVVPFDWQIRERRGRIGLRMQPLWDLSEGGFEFPVPAQATTERLGALAGPV